MSLKHPSNDTYFYDDYKDKDYDFDDYDDFPISKKNFKLLIGSCYISYSLMLIFLQILLFIIFLTKKKFLANMPYKIMFHLGIYSLFQQICHFISGIYLIFNIKLQMWCGFAIGSMYESSYITSVAFVFILTINRFDSFLQSRLFLLEV
ncbi:Hypothetical protein SRAE_1000287400 [Strongyloides ratti]|uniref:Uncharacterized protein n=1 Tax=Strongyloides ratti TaxID=34506 RepID=A0A090L491_STRRB|nr:Hypothetical protein SRAE_1000287400 [Strongyloides ratti]CEF64621.1 Hypothetical protein SRAE_1000287400 [Strongyloides ratti]